MPLDPLLLEILACPDTHHAPLTYDEAAQTMGTSVGAVRSHLARGRGRLRTAVHGSDTRPPFAPRPAAALPSAIGPPSLPPALACAGVD